MKHASYLAGDTMKEQNDIFLLMKIISDKASTLFTSRVELPLTAAQCRVMGYLRSRAGENVAQKDIEKHLGVTHTTAKGLLQRLEEKGFVRTAFDSEDKRVKRVYVTDKSMKLKEKIEPMIRNFEESNLQGIAPGDIAVAVGVLKQIYANLSTQNEHF